MWTFSYIFAATDGERGDPLALSHPLTGGED
ncbi:hypothetical protein HNR73_003487 [Phytomonospora endophytica]|uniref:Uncharacterized protein n=1 Tax=Phytomonospora endophytica TaxID=714109 RepID=A0A841FL21_9ACTN|nr:hypothetical protein [Phytomonospora endophytica]